MGDFFNNVSTRLQQLSLLGALAIGWHSHSKQAGENWALAFIAQEALSSLNEKLQEKFHRRMILKGA